MAKSVNIYDAKTQLSQLVDRAAKGEEIVIARAGRPVARLVALHRSPVMRKPGRMRGRLRIGRNFEAPLPADLFEK
ncbi:MAG TPA: type II toxin-antitoxin system prevent-host-death family antitoxin [Thermoanaerobaculia bacterium]|jgi:prevent-host-death family protein